MEKYLLEIEGTTPLLMEKYVGAVKTSSKKVDYSQEWKEKTYIDKEGYVIITGEMFKACIAQGAKGIKKGKYFMSKLIPSGLVIQNYESRIHIEDKTITLKDIEKNGWIQEFRKVIAGRSNIGNRTMIPTAMASNLKSYGWKTTWNLINRDPVLSQDDIKMVIENAGIYAGLGGQRPSSPRKPGNYGQFKISKFELVK